MDSNKVEACVEDVRADFSRQGHLALSDVQRLIDQHHLDGSEMAAVFVALGLHGVSIRDDTPVEPPQPVENATFNKAVRDTLSLMMRSAGRTRLLSADEEVVLGRRIRIGQNLAEESEGRSLLGLEAKQIEDGKQAHDQLVLANVRLVISIARRYRPTGMELSDLIQEGTIGLMRAADKFDHTLGYKFSTYATWWIRQAIQRSIADKSRLIRLPVYVSDKIQKVRATQSDLRVRLEREPTHEEIAASAGMAAAEISSLLDIARDPISIDAPVGYDTDTDLGELLDLYSADVAEEVMKSIFNTEIRDALEDAGSSFALRYRGASAHAVDMLKLRYGLDTDEEQTLDQIGAHFGVTRERARQILNKIMKFPPLQRSLAELSAID